MPAIFGETYSLSSGLCISHSSRSYELIEDLTKALCFITGKDFNRVPDLRDALRSPFWVKDKKGTGHFKFKDRDVWAQFNQHIARIKGYPLFEPKPSNKQS